MGKQKVLFRKRKHKIYVCEKIVDKETKLLIKRLTGEKINRLK